MGCWEWCVHDNCHFRRLAKDERFLFSCRSQTQSDLSTYKGVKDGECELI